MKNRPLLLMTILLTSSLIGVQFAYADTPKPTVEVDPLHIGIVLGIGLAGAIVTSLEGKIKSGQKWNGGKFFIAVKRTAAISIPSTFAMIAFNPDPTIMDYVIVGLAVVLGAKMMHTKRPSTGTNTTPESVTVEISVIQTTVQKAPPLGPAGNWYQTNFIQDQQRGNVLHTALTCGSRFQEHAAMSVQY